MKRSMIPPAWFSAARLALRRFGWLPVAILLVHAVGVRAFDAYERWPAFDIPMHLLGGLAIAFFVSGTLTVLHDSALTGPLDTLLYFPLVFGLTTAATVFWEFAEWSVDRLFETGCQLSLDDTLLDMLLGILGGCVFLVGRVSLRMSTAGKEEGKVPTWTSN